MRGTQIAIGLLKAAAAKGFIEGAKRIGGMAGETLEGVIGGAYGGGAELGKAIGAPGVVGGVAGLAALAGGTTLAARKANAAYQNWKFRNFGAPQQGYYY